MTSPARDEVLNIRETTFLKISLFGKKQIVNINKLTIDINEKIHYNVARKFIIKQQQLNK